MTYGQLRLRISKLAPGIDLELIDGWIQDRYTEILDFVPWKRTEADSVFQVPVTYQVGTVTGTLGSTGVTGVGTTWTSAMTGRMIRIANSTEYYTFTYVGATSGTLDRGFEQPSASGLSYRIDQNVFLLPSSCRILRGVRPLHDLRRPLDVLQPGDLNRIDPFRNVYGVPLYAAQTWDESVDPPVMQVELYPIPDNPDSAGDIMSFVADYIYDAAALTPTSTSSDWLPWVRPAALIAGVEADIAAHKGDVAKVQIKEARFASLLQEMLRINAQLRGPQSLRTADQFKRNTAGIYQRRRWVSDLGGFYRDGGNG